MMNSFKKSTALFMAICLMFSLSACSGGKEESELTQGFEFHFYPEEYEKEYSEASKTLYLNAGMDYQLKLDAACESGTMEISIVYGSAESKTYAVNADTPCNELLILPANTAGEVTITVSIEQDTKGAVIGDLLLPGK